MQQRLIQKKTRAHFIQSFDKYFKSFPPFCLHFGQRDKKKLGTHTHTGSEQIAFSRNIPFSFENGLIERCRKEPRINKSLFSWYYSWYSSCIPITSLPLCVVVSCNVNQFFCGASSPSSSLSTLHQPKSAYRYTLLPYIHI